MLPILWLLTVTWPPYIAESSISSAQMSAELSKTLLHTYKLHNTQVHVQS